MELLCTLYILLVEWGDKYRVLSNYCSTVWRFDSSSGTVRVREHVLFARRFQVTEGARTEHLKYGYCKQTRRPRIRAFAFHPFPDDGSGSPTFAVHGLRENLRPVNICLCPNACVCLLSR